jgi:predicted enzyme related to lactoylglutathione lyase
MHKAAVVPFEIAANDRAAPKRFDARLFGWQIQAVGTGPGGLYAVASHGDGIGGGIDAVLAGPDRGRRDDRST